MNHHHRISDDARAEREARVLAVVLGMASADEIAAVEQLLLSDPDLRAYRDELTETLPSLRAALQVSADAPDLRMDEARRAVLLGKLRGTKTGSETGKTINPISQLVLKEAAANIVPWPVLFRQNIGAIAACVVFATVGVFVALPAFMPAERRFVAEAEYNESAVSVFSSGAGGGDARTSYLGAMDDMDSSNLKVATHEEGSRHQKLYEWRSSEYSSGGKPGDSSTMQAEDGLLFYSDSNSAAESVSRERRDVAGVSEKQKAARLNKPAAASAPVPSLGDKGRTFLEDGRASVKQDMDASGGSSRALSGRISSGFTLAPAQGAIVTTPSSAPSSEGYTRELIASDIPAKPPTFPQEGRVVNGIDLLSEAASNKRGIALQAQQKERKVQSERQETSVVGSPRELERNVPASESGALRPLNDMLGSTGVVSGKGTLTREPVSASVTSTAGTTQNERDGLGRQSGGLAKNESLYAGTTTLDLNGKLDYESEYIYRGKEHAPESGIASGKGSGGGMSGGATAVRNGSFLEANPNVGLSETETAVIPIPTSPVVKMTGMAAAASSDSSSPFDGGSGGSTTGSAERPEEIALKRFLQREGIPFDVPGSALSFDGANLIVTQSRHNLEKIKGILAAYAEEEAKAAEKAEAPAFRLVDTSAADNAFSTFSLNVSDVSFRLAAEALSQSRWPDKDSLRTEEFVNAVKYNDPPPVQNEAVSLTQEQARHPFAHNRDLLRLSVQTASAGRNSRQPLNLTVLLDTSGSMTRADRQEIVEVALQALADNLSPNDTVSVIGFSRNPRLLVDRVNGATGAAQLRALAGRIPPEGGTNLELALQAAYEKSRSVQVPGVQSTIVLLTDGAANLGDAKPENLARIIAQNKKLGIGLNCYGIGFDGYNDAMLETLARTGNGRYAYLNNADEARSDFAAKLAGALQVAAQNVKVQVEFNPARVETYRLMGYEKHRLKKEEFRDDSVAAAELGAAESGTAVYSIQVKPDGAGDIGVVRVRYQEPSTGDYKEREWSIPYSPAVPAFENAAPGVQLAATAALFAEKLEGTEEAQAVSLSSLVKYLKKANNSLGAFPENRKLQSMLETATRLE